MNDCVRSIHSNVLALKYARRGDYRTAARIWVRASKSRFCDAKILFNLAICYQNGLGITKDLAKVIMLALWNRPDHYICILWFLLLLSFFSSPNLNRCRLDVCHTCTHGVALVQI